jgi:hypothetical protein
VPKVRSGVSSYPRWFSRELIELTQRKKVLHRTFKETLNTGHYNEFARVRAECVKLRRSCFESFIRKAESTTVDMKGLWSLKRSLGDADRGLPREMYLKNKRVCGTDEVADLFAKHFGGVYEKPIGIAGLRVSGIPDILNLPTLELDLHGVNRALSGLDGRKSAGPDGIPSSFLKGCREALTVPLTFIYNKSLQQGYFPNVWKTGYVTPIHKKGDKQDVGNYRPICLQSSIPKIFESLVLEKLLPSIVSTISSRQHGFVPRRSTNKSCYL